MFWLCKKCEHYGTIAGTMMIPDEVFFAKCAAEFKERKGLFGGEELSVEQIAILLEQGDKTLELLMRESPYR